jgi:hypothetical protein
VDLGFAHICHVHHLLFVALKISAEIAVIMP